MSKIYIDAGHGGADPGAIGVGGVHEADINLKVALHLQDELERNGQTVKMCRTHDIYKDLSERTAEANAWGADYYISIHCNAYDGASANGTETYCYKKGGNGEKIAKAIQKELLVVLKTSDRCKDYGGSKEANFYVLRKTNMPAALTELAFVTNKGDCAKLVDASYQKKCAVAICKGICSYLGVTYKAEEKEVEKNDYTGHWAEAAIKEVIKDKTMVGDGNGKFRPNDKITRGEVAQLVVNLKKYFGK